MSIVQMLRACYHLGNNTPHIFHRVKEMTIKETTLKCLLWDCFHNYSYALTFTIKGTRRGVNLTSIKAQKDFIGKLIGEVLEPRSLQFIIFYEYHACGDYLHIHGIVNHKSHNQFRQCRKEIYQRINATERRITKYKPSVDYNRVANLTSWLKYIIKDYTFMKDMSNIHPLYNFNGGTTHKVHVPFMPSTLHKFLHSEELHN